MKKTIRVKYRSIFKYEADQETIQFDTHGYLQEDGESRIISFNDENLIKIVLKKDEVYLHNGNSTLHLMSDCEVANNYDTDYGAVALKTRLVSYECGDSIKIKYELYDGENLLNQVYLLINYIILEN